MASWFYFVGDVEVFSVPFSTLKSKLKTGEMTQTKCLLCKHEHPLNFIGAGTILHICNPTCPTERRCKVTIEESPEAHRPGSIVDTTENLKTLPHAR